MEKWMALMFIALIVVLGGGQALDIYSKNMAKRDIIVSCYAAGNKDCQTLWSKEIK